MRMLFLAPALPWPPHSGGSRRIAAILERLSARHEVYLLALEGDGGSVEATINAPLAGVRTLAYPGLTPRSRAGFWRQVLTDPLPKAVRQAISDEALEIAATFARACRPEAILAEPIEMHPYLAACAAAVPSAQTMMGWIDVVSLNVARQTMRDTDLAHRVHARREVQRMVRLERTAARTSGVRTCVSAVDQAALERLTGRSFVVAPNGVDIEHFKPRSGPVNDGQALFVGPLAFAPNRDAVAWFAAEVLPLLDQVSLTVAGEPAGFLAPRGVGLAGRVTDVRTVMAHAGVVVAPLRSGSGTRLKILEALAMGKAVVSTTLGAEGLDVVHAEHLMIADDAASFADAVTKILRDVQLREKLGRNGRALVEQSYRWETTVARIEDALTAQVTGAAV